MTIRSAYATLDTLTAALAPTLPVESAMLCRMSDKVARVANLQGREQDAAVAETLDETMADLAGYAILYLARPDERRPLKKIVGV